MVGAGSGCVIGCDCMAGNDCAPGARVCGNGPAATVVGAWEATPAGAYEARAWASAAHAWEASGNREAGSRTTHRLNHASNAGGSATPRRAARAVAGSTGPASIMLSKP